MKVRNVLLLVLATVLLFNCSCQKPQSGQESSSDGEVLEQPEPQYMAYRCSKVSYVDDDIYLIPGVSFSKPLIYASELDSKDFEVFLPCFDAVCDHGTENCCLTTIMLGGRSELLAAFMYNGEPALVIFNPINTCLSLPYSNTKTTLFCEDYLKADDPVAAYREWYSSEERTQRSEPLVYRDNFYYVELKNGVRTQYRIPLTGGKPERVFEEDNIIIRTIINDKLFGIRYENVDPNDPWEALQDRDNINYFRSDMNYENVEPLPEMIDYFALPGDVNFVAGGIAILDADADYIYFTNGQKVWALPDADIYAEPIKLSDMGDKIPYEVSIDLQQTACYSEGSIYAVVNFDMYKRSLLDSNGYSATPTQWYEESMFYSFDIKTGEYRTLDISNENYIMTTILYSDGKYVYGEGSYAHEDGRAIQGVTMRLTLDTMRYEVILPDRFWKYSAETTSE